MPRAFHSLLSMTRREFIAITSGAAGVALTSPPVMAENIGAELPTHRFRIRRQEDLLSLELSFINFERKGDELRALGSGRSLVVVRFPSQNLAEARFDKASEIAEQPNPNVAFEYIDETVRRWEETPLPAPKKETHNFSPIPPIASYLSGPSWVVFSVPDQTSIPLSMEAAYRIAAPCGGVPNGVRSVVDVWLHTFGNWPIRVPEIAVNPGHPNMPAGDETCLEIPFRLFIAPKTKTAKWITSSTPALKFEGPKPNGAIELWHAALHDRTKLSPATPPPDFANLPPELAPPKRVTLQARAVFSPDFQQYGDPPWGNFYPGKLPLSHRALDRHSLVRQMMLDNNGWIDAEHLILSPLGADASLSYYMQTTFREFHDKQLQGGDFQLPDLAIWKHRQVIGRDVFLLAVRPGFLFPLVIPALFVELTRRTFVSRATSIEEESAPGATAEEKLKAHQKFIDEMGFGPPGAYLLTEYYILVQDPQKQFGDSGNALGRNMPLKKATMLQTRSPLLRRPDKTEFDEAFIPRMLDGGAYVRWPIEYEDESGRRSETPDACMIFARRLETGHKKWNEQPPEIRKWSMPAQRVGLAPEKAQLSNPAATSGRPTKHTLIDAERAPAAQLVKAIREELEAKLEEIADKAVSEQERLIAEAIKERFENLCRLGEANANLPAEVKAAVSQLEGETARFLADTFKNLSNDAHVETEIVATLLAQFASGERVFVDQIDAVIPPDQRTAATKIAELLREELNKKVEQPRAVFDKLKRLPGSLNEFSPDVKENLAKLNGLLGKISDVANRFKAPASVQQRVMDDVLQQLARAEQAATDVEVHAIDFGSRRVNELLNTLRNELPAELIDAPSQAAFLDNLKNFVKVTDPADVEEFNRLSAEFTTLWQGLPDDWDVRQKEANSFLFDLQSEANKSVDSLRHGFQPCLNAADVIVPALKAMGGTTGPQELKLLADYAAKGIDNVQNSVFGQFTNKIDEGRAMADRVKCAVAAPATQIAGLSRDMGALVGEGQAAVQNLARQAENIDIRNAIPDFKLLGVLPLDKIVSAVLGKGELPTISMVTLPDRIEQIWEWNAKLQETDLGLLKFVPGPKGKKNAPNPFNDPVHIYIKATTRVDVPQPGQNIAPSAGSVHMEGVLSFWNRATKKPKPIRDGDEAYSFSLRILELIDIKFIDVSFTADYRVGENPKPKVKPRLGVVDFLPPLDFVKTLQEALPFLGKGFQVVQSPGRIGISYEFIMPSIAFGAFSMRNLAIGSAVLLSFEGKPLRFDFNFSSWQEPFELTVLCFGGRGFLKVAADTGGYRDLQGMIEFGGALSFNVVIASGGLYVMAGIYFRNTPEATTVAGFLRAGGCLNVLGLIHASVEFLLMASYVRTSRGSLLAGEASVVVCIDLFLVSYDVTVRMYKEFAGSSEPTNDSNAFLLDRDNPFRLASSTGANDSAPEKFPLAYFERRPKVGKVLGRFKEVEKWNEEYWSQFAF
jgi:hypothetical protein